MAIDAKAKALKAAGEPVIGFGAGEPDFADPGHIVEAAVAACTDPKNHKYTPAGGLPELREAVAAKTERDSGWAGVKANQVLVTNGGKHAVETGVRRPARPRRRGAAARPLLDDLPRVDPPGGRRAGGAGHHVRTVASR